MPPAGPLPKRLSADQVARYRRDGFVAPITVMTEDQAAALRARIEALERTYGPLHYKVKPTLFVTAADEIAHCPALLDAVEDILGPDILAWDSAFIIKEPGTSTFVSWHQDLTYWGLDKVDDVVSVWLALSPATVESGTMSMIPGSHRTHAAHRPTTNADNILSRGQTVDVAPEDAARAVPIVLRPGQMSLHHGLVLHASGGNHSADRRIGFNMNLITPAVRQTQVADDSALLLRGTDRNGHFRHEPRPASDFSADGCAYQAAVARARGASVNADPGGRLVNQVSRQRA
jgi:hypothetical protein